MSPGHALGARPPLPRDWGTRADSDFLREWRALRRISQRDLADILGVTNVTVARWELGDRPTPPYLHLALESIDRRLVFSAAPPGVPQERPRRPKPRRGMTSIGL